MWLIIICTHALLGCVVHVSFSLWVKKSVRNAYCPSRYQGYTSMYEQGLTQEFFKWETDILRKICCSH